MIFLDSEKDTLLNIRFIKEKSEEWESLLPEVRAYFSGKSMETGYVNAEHGKVWLLVGLGPAGEVDALRVKEACAKAAKEVKKCGQGTVSVFGESLLALFGAEVIRYMAEGLLLGCYEFSCNERSHAKEGKPDFYIRGVAQTEEIRRLVQETVHITEGILFARDMVNMPGNMLRPMEFARKICEFLEGTEIETKQLVAANIKSLGMNGLGDVGHSSEYPPCFLVLRYFGNKDSSEIFGLAGKGVTCDTGGYCLKSAGSMTGIKGDMAGAAAVAGAMYALAQNKVKVNAVGLLPMCENRLSKSSLLPGDVITSMSGKTIEVINTDAEGRLILADALTYGIREEGVTRILDIATLTGSVVSALGFSIAGVLTDNEKLWQEFKKASETAGEKYWRLPIAREHEKMLESKIADIKNMGESYCGTITAGLFIRAFAEEKPWIHLDIAGSAWMDTPVYEFQEKGATGAGTSTIYYLCKEAEHVFR